MVESPGGLSCGGEDSNKGKEIGALMGVNAPGKLRVEKV
jgi:hypothetical protein